MFARRLGRLLLRSPARSFGARQPVRAERRPPRSSTRRSSSAYVMVFAFERGPADAAAPLHRPGGGLRPLRDPRRPDRRRDLGADPRACSRSCAATTSNIAVQLEARHASRPRLEVADGADRRLARRARSPRGAPRAEAACGRGRGRCATSSAGGPTWLDAANRCARAPQLVARRCREAFGAFIRELRGLLPFDRVAIVLAEDGVAQVMATAGAGVEDGLPAGTRRSRSRARCST